MDKAFLFYCIMKQKWIMTNYESVLWYCIDYYHEDYRFLKKKNSIFVIALVKWCPDF